MHQPVVIGKDDIGLVYEQSDHNQQLCIQARFPDLENLFYYDDGKIVGFNREFVWRDAGVNADVCVNFVLTLVQSSEKSNVVRFTNPDTFAQTISLVCLFV